MQGVTKHNVVFSGKAGEFFGIWIVNILLSVLTLGIYSAWAKVRTNKYLYQNLTIDGRPFDYHATGKQILIGRIIVVLGLVAFSLLATIPIVNILILIGWFFLVPWLIVRSIRFNARVTSWSGLRFDFEGRSVDAFLSYILYPILSAFTLYLTMPFAIRSQKRFALNNFRFGASRFAFDAKIGGFYFAMFLATVWAIGFYAAALFVAISLGGLASIFNAPSGGALDAAAIRLNVFIYAVAFGAILPAGYIYQSLVRNHVYNNTTLEGGHGLQSTVTPWKMIWIGVSNAVVSILSLGLMVPWARVRMLTYLANSTQVQIAGDIDEFIGSPAHAQSAVGDAFSDIEGLDIGLPI